MKIWPRAAILSEKFWNSEYYDNVYFGTDNDNFTNSSILRDVTSRIVA